MSNQGLWRFSYYHPSECQMTPLQALEAFNQKIRISEELFGGTPHFLWAGGGTKDGYSQFSYNGTKYMAHRWIYEVTNGPVLDGFDLDHVCRVRRCVNVSHLEVVTHKVNMSRSEAITAINARKTHCIHGHEFTPENTLKMGANGRKCRACHQQLKRDARKRKKQGVT